MIPANQSFYKCKIRCGCSFFLLNHHNPTCNRVLYNSHSNIATYTKSKIFLNKINLTLYNNSSPPKFQVVEAFLFPYLPSPLHSCATPALYNHIIFHVLPFPHVNKLEFFLAYQHILKTYGKNLLKGKTIFHNYFKRFIFYFI